MEKRSKRLPGSQFRTSNPLPRAPPRAAADLALVRPRAAHQGPHFMKYDWKDSGEEWSAPWGNSAAQWFGTILPRTSQCLPAGTILEIAPGFGRWTNSQSRISALIRSPQAFAVIFEIVRQPNRGWVDRLKRRLPPWPPTACPWNL